MGDYTAPPAPATCESVNSDVSVDAAADIPVAYDRGLDADVCLDVDITEASDRLAVLDAAASLE